MTVAVLEHLQRTAELKDSDLRIEWYSGTGAGGQHRNKHQNSCRLIHLPTGTIATAQCRSRENSLAEARATLQQRVSDAQKEKQYGQQALFRKEQVGSGERGDKFRTYRFQDGLVKDHRTNRQASIDKVLAGNFNLLW